MAVDNKIPADVKKMSFEAAMEELEEIVRTLEEGKGDLDHSINAYARGAMLKQHCENKLNDAKSRIEKIILDENGDPQIVAFDVEWILKI